MPDTAGVTSSFDEVYSLLRGLVGSHQLWVRWVAVELLGRCSLWRMPGGRTPSTVHAAACRGLQVHRIWACHWTLRRGGPMWIEAPYRPFSSQWPGRSPMAFQTEVFGHLMAVHHAVRMLPCSPAPLVEYLPSYSLLLLLVCLLLTHLSVRRFVCLLV